MEMRMRGSTKGQLMTILVLVLFLLMLAALVAFITLNIDTSAQNQVAVQALSSSNYGRSIATNAQTFAGASAQRALQVLFAYEYNASLRHDNFIPDLGAYMGSLMVNGTLPGVAPGSAAANALLAGMANLTFASYNAALASAGNQPSQQLSISESTPVISQSSPYALQATYGEHVTINASGSIYNFTVPVNASVQLNGTPDLFFAQQGVFRTVTFAGTQNLTRVIGGAQAVSGNTASFAYGTVFVANSVSTCSNPPYNLGFDKSVILVTASPSVWISCLGSFGGMITDTPPGFSPSVPYLQYSSGAVLSDLETGQEVLLYGPTLSTYDISNLADAVSDGYYFTSQFTPSYSQRASSSLFGQSNAGIFTFSLPEVGGLDGTGSSISANLLMQPSTSETQVAWVYASSFPGTGSTITDQAAGIGGLSLSSSGNVLFFAGSASPVSAPSNIATGGWYMLSGTYNGNTETVCIDAVSCASAPATGSVSSIAKFYMGSLGGSSPYMDGYLAGVQVYNGSLSPSQLQKLYQDGIEGLPAGNAGLVGWWPLNGNASDYSGFGDNGAATTVSYSVAPGYDRDDILMHTVPTPVAPLPGVLDCSSQSQCDDSALPHFYIGQMSLEVGQQNQLAASFGGSANIAVADEPQLDPSGITMSAWFEVNDPAANSMLISKASSGTGDDYDMFFANNAFGASFVTSGVSGGCTASFAANPGEWYFGTATYDPTSGTVLLYINGTNTGGLCRPTSGLIASSGNPLLFGSQASGNYLNGNMTDVQLYDTSLSASQVQQLYANGVSALPLTLNGLSGWWPLNGNANDYSGFGDNGQGMGVAWVPLGGVYNSSGPSGTTGVEDEWQSIGLAYP